LTICAIQSHTWLLAWPVEAIARWGRGMVRILSKSLITAVFIDIAVHTTCTFKIEKHYYKHIIKKTELKYNRYKYLFLNNLAVFTCWVLQYFSK